MSVKEDLLAVIQTEVRNMKRRADEGMLLPEDVAKIPSLARAAQIIQELKDTTTQDQRTQDELEALVERGGQGRG